MIVYDVQIESVDWRLGAAKGKLLRHHRTIRKMAGAQINWPCRWVWCLLAASLPRDNSGAWCTVLRCVSVCHVNAFASIDVVQASLKLAIGWHWIKHELWHFASLASWLIYGPRLSVCGVCVIFQATATEAKCANALRGFCRSRNRTLKRANRCTARRRCAIVRTNYDFCFAYLVAVSGGVLLRYSEYNEPHDKPKEQRASTHKKMDNLAEEWNRFEALARLATYRRCFIMTFLSPLFLRVRAWFVWLLWVSMYPPFINNNRTKQITWDSFMRCEMKFKKNRNYEALRISTSQKNIADLYLEKGKKKWDEIVEHGAFIYRLRVLSTLLNRPTELIFWWSH